MARAAGLGTRDFGCWNGEPVKYSGIHTWNLGIWNLGSVFYNTLRVLYHTKTAKK